MWEAILVSLLSFSVSMRAPKVENVPFDYELSCQIENTTNRSDFLFKYDYERENGDYFNDLRAKFNYSRPIILFGVEFPNSSLLFKEDFKLIKSKDLHQFVSDLRYQSGGISIGGAFIWDLQDDYEFAPSVGVMKNIKIKKWEFKTDNDLYITKPLTYQSDLKTTFYISDKVGLSILNSYIKTKNSNDYSTRLTITVKLK